MLNSKYQWISNNLLFGHIHKICINKVRLQRVFDKIQVEKKMQKIDYQTISLHITPIH